MKKFKRRVCSRCDCSYEPHGPRQKICEECFSSLRANGMKWCGRCGEDKPHAAFNKDSKNRDGLYAACRDCGIRWDRGWYYDNRDYKLTYNRQWYDENREYVSERRRRHRQEATQ